MECAGLVPECEKAYRNWQCFINKGVDKLSVQVVDAVIEKMNDVKEKDCRLIMLIGPRGSGKTRVLKEVERLTGAPRVNVTLELSRRLLNIDSEDRPLKAGEVFKDMLADLRMEDGTFLEAVLLDDIEALFEPYLELDAIQVLREVSRNKTVVAACTGKVEEDSLLCFDPKGNRYLEFPLEDLVVVQIAT